MQVFLSIARCYCAGQDARAGVQHGWLPDWGWTPELGGPGELNKLGGGLGWNLLPGRAGRVESSCLAARRLVVRTMTVKLCLDLTRHESHPAQAAI